ncbi:hypothetical protein HCN44_009581 [Aphidius gifuensis]|uniref:Succinate dehydrogenase [ubiquinone] cytochrome b small subunit n=1 Tax=Aphidius gifuensis TaxID=684658 RepID=A0A834Y6S5_APHGI|nr:succinate dehydrogenase [ubiquinone] cytochrome b small subunit, mitochondrial [Aphidius gifuensis]KAF7998183.1 hypothetical protein HCN44_009581 [Aphidius gifuensis]
MAYLMRCQFAKSIPTLSKLLTGSSRLAVEKKLPITVRNYNSLVKNVKHNGLVPVKNVCQKSNKLTGALGIFANQIRASSHGDHVRLWQMERIVAASFVVLFPGVILLQNPIIDVAFSLLVVMHAHWGLEAVILDYARPAVVGKILPKVLMLALYLLSGITLAGLGAVIYNGPGVGGSIKRIWAIGNDKK